MACPGSSVTSANFLRRTLRICPTVQVATSDSSVSSLHCIPLVAGNPGIAGGNPAGPTLRDPIRYPAAALAALYRRRWQIELNFDDLKTSPGMNHLACQSTDMALRLVTMDQCAYNLIRALMQQSAHAGAVPLYRLSLREPPPSWPPRSPGCGPADDRAAARIFGPCCKPSSPATPSPCAPGAPNRAPANAAPPLSTTHQTPPRNESHPPPEELPQTSRSRAILVPFRSGHYFCEIIAPMANAPYARPICAPSNLSVLAR